MDRFEVLKELGLIDQVNFWTGEITQRHSYAVRPMPALPAPPSLGLACTRMSTSRMERMLSNKDKRRLVRVNDVRRIYDADKGDHHYRGRTVGMTNAQHDLLNLLVQRIDYRNVIVGTLPELAQLLAVRPNHLNRKLSTLGGIIRVSGSTGGVRRGDLMIEINPAYGFRYEKDALPYVRAHVMERWIDSIIGRD